MAVIQFIGLGTMGAPMVRQLTAAGFRVHVSDVNREAAEALAAETGAVFAADARRSEGVDTVILMLPNSAVVNAVLGDAADPESLLRALAAGSTVIDMSSSSPDATRANHTRLAELGLRLIDAPVSGGPLKAASGELTIMAGTDDEASYEQVLPVLGAMGTSITRTGPVGSAHALKALNNLLSVIGIVGALEVLAVGTKFGLDAQLMLDVLNKSTGRNHATEVKIGPQVLTHNWNVGFSLSLTVKDITTALELARSEGIEVPVSEAAVEVAASALELLTGASEGGQAPDQSQIAEYIERRNGIRFDQTTKQEER